LYRVAFILRCTVYLFCMYIISNMTSSISFRLFRTLYGFTECKINEWMKVVSCMKQAVLNRGRHSICHPLTFPLLFKLLTLGAKVKKPAPLGYFPSFKGGIPGFWDYGSDFCLFPYFSVLFSCQWMNFKKLYKCYHWRTLYFLNSDNDWQWYDGHIIM